jgi:hypothetical protein
MAVGVDAATGLMRRLPPLAPELVRSSVQAAVRVAAGQATNPVVSGAVASLVQGAIWRTTMIKLGGIAAGAMLVGLVGYGAGLAAQRVGDAVAVRRATGDDHNPQADPGRSTGARPAEAEPAPGAAQEKNERRASDAQILSSNAAGETRIVKTVPDGMLVNPEAARMLLMLEDDRERIERFTATLGAIAPSMPLVVWRSAGKMIREIEPYLSAARLISLDHNLEPVEGEDDPGDGRRLGPRGRVRAPLRVLRGRDPHDRAGRRGEVGPADGNGSVPASCR